MERRTTGNHGRFLHAHYLVEPDGDRLALILESRTGRPVRNSEYNPALTLLLTRMAALAWCCYRAVPSA
jgi:hypothetical protein